MADSFIRWSIQPLSRILILFFVGNIFSETIQFSTLVFVVLLLFLICLLLFVKQKTLSSALLFAFIFVSGMLNFNVQKRKTKNFSGAYHIVKVLPEPTLKNDKVILDAKIIGTFQNGTWEKAIGKSRIEIDSGINLVLGVGDYFLLYDSITKPAINRLPLIFDYNEYLHTIGIDYYVKTNVSRICIFKNDEISLNKFAIQTRDMCINSIKRHNINKDELAVISALILGAKSDLDKQLIQDYTQSGIVHILAVSGLHVGLLYVAFLFLLKPFKRILPSLLFVFLVLTFLWFYAVLTGLSPSVLRATAMCSFIVVASVYKLRITNFNLLASAAFFMLLYDADVWKQLGFQLSYIAVWSIFAFKPFLDFGNNYRNWLTRNIIKASSLSLVAQVATSPLCLFYFGTFPVYSLVANLIAVPLSTALTYIGVSAMLLGSVPYLGFCLVKFLEFGIFVMNSFAHFVSSLPLATIHHIFISKYIAICFAIVIFFFSTLFIRFNILKLKLVLFAFLLLSIVQTTELFYNAIKTKYFVVSIGNKTQAIVFKKNNFFVFDFWNFKNPKHLDNRILQLANKSNIDKKNINIVDLSKAIPSRRYYFRYIRKCVLAS
jgi:competence protein ComEC